MLPEYFESVAEQMARDHGHLQSHDRLDMYLSGLCEEVGEVHGLRKRDVRRNDRDFMKWSANGEPLTEKEFEQKLHSEYVDELGDVVWYVAALCHEMGISAEQLLKHNEGKLEVRYGSAK